MLCQYTYFLCHIILLLCFLICNTKLMAQSKTNIYELLMQWKYRSLALSHQNVLAWTPYGKVTQVGLSCYLVLLTRQSHLGDLTHMKNCKIYHEQISHVLPGRPVVWQSLSPQCLLLVFEGSQISGVSFVCVCATPLLTDWRWLGTAPTHTRHSYQIT